MEQQRKEQERLAQLERAEQERKERERQEQERKRQLELEKQLEKQRELERQREEDRRKEIERREVRALVCLDLLSHHHPPIPELSMTCPGTANTRLSSVEVADLVLGLDRGISSLSALV